jgi:hypothetical protein
MTLARRGLLVLWMVTALWMGMLAAYVLRFLPAVLVASLGMGSRGTGLVALWTIRVVGAVAVWIGAGRAVRWWPALSRRRLTIGALSGFVGGTLLGHVLRVVVGDAGANVNTAIALVGYCVGVLGSSVVQQRHENHGAVEQADAADEAQGGTRTGS